MERFSGAVNVVHNYLLTRYGIDVLHAVLRHKLGKTTESAFRSEVAGKNVKWGGEAMKRIANRLRMRFVATYPEFLGEDRSSRYIIVPNHVSMMDVYAICAYMGQISHTNLRWIMAAHVRKFPFIGKGAELQGSAFVSRKGRPEDRAALERCARVVLEDDADVVIFPEGKRCSRERVKSFSSPYRHLLPPRRNGLKILKECLPTTSCCRSPSPMWIRA
jgi:1-acyl-sn-glycerol-3-phosphate acyltransferase